MFHLPVQISYVCIECTTSTHTQYRKLEREVEYKANHCGHLGVHPSTLRPQPPMYVNVFNGHTMGAILQPDVGIVIDSPVTSLSWGKPKVNLSLT